MPALIYARLPSRPRAKHHRVIELLIAMNRAGYRDAVWQCIEMCKDVRQHGRQSRFVTALKGYNGILELKPTTRGGQRGGARVYFFWLSTGSPVLVGAEWKANGDPPNAALIEETYDVLIAVQTGRLTL